MTAIVRRIRPRECDVILSGTKCTNAAQWEILYDLSLGGGSLLMCEYCFQDYEERSNFTFDDEVA